MRVGVFGGTFDPIHIGHLMVGEEARVELQLTQVVFLPAGQPYFKERGTVASAADRLEMVKLAIASNPDFVASALDMSRPGPTYTLDTLVDLRKELGPSCEMYLVLGSDVLQELDCWHRASEVMSLAAGIIGVSRPGVEDLDQRVAEAVAPGAPSNVTLIDGVSIDISSTEVRERIAEGRSIRYMVPDVVEQYIRERGLYRPPAGG